MATISRVDLRKDPGPEEDMPLALSFSAVYFVTLNAKYQYIFCFLNRILGVKFFFKFNDNIYLSKENSAVAGLK